LVSNDNGSTINVRSDAGSGIVKTTPGAAIGIAQGDPIFKYFGTITNAPSSGNGYLLEVAEISGGSVTVTGPGASPLSDTGNGIAISGTSGGTVNVQKASLASAGPQALLVEDSIGAFNFTEIDILGGDSFGVLLNKVGGSGTTFDVLNITLAGANATGFAATNAGNVTVNNPSTIFTASTSQPAISVYDTGGATNLTLEFTSVVSANTNVTPATNTAISLTDAAASGTIDISSVFDVGVPPVAGGTANVFNVSGTTVRVGGTQISP